MTFRPLCQRVGCWNRCKPSLGDKPRKYCSDQCAAAARSTRRDEKTPRTKRTDRKRQKATVGKIALRVRRADKHAPIPPTGSKEKKAWNAFLAASGESVSRGEFLTGGAPHGCGKTFNVTDLERVDAQQQQRKRGGPGRPIYRTLKTTVFGKLVKMSGYSLNKAKEKLPGSVNGLKELLSRELAKDFDGNGVAILERMKPPKPKKREGLWDSIAETEARMQ